MGTCVICGQESSFRSDSWTSTQYYFERAMSKTEYMCKECHDKKYWICNYASDGEKRNEAIESIRSLVKDKSNIVKDVVNDWIEGNERVYYSNVKNLLYYVPGPEATLFVFKDYFTILSSFQNWDDTKDYIYVYKHKTSYRNGNYHWPDINKINDSLERGYRGTDDSAASVTLNFSLGANGTLNFTNCCFEFYYHQNQLMDEAYNYIQKRIANPDVEDDIEQQVGKVQQIQLQNTYSQQTEKKEDTSQIIYSPADEIRKMKELLDCGILSQEEFERAKNRMIDKL